MGMRPWKDVRPHVVTSEERVAEHAAKLDAEVELHRALGDLARHLPAEAATEAVAELAAAAPAGRPAVLAAWRSTAMVYANPELHAALTRDSHEDGGPVPRPCGDTVPCSDDCSHGQAFRQLVALDEELGVYDQPAPSPEEWREVRRQVAEKRRGRPEA